MFSKTSKVVCVIALHGRFSVSSETIRRLQQQTHKVEIVAVGGPEERDNIKHLRDCFFVEHENEPLGKKWQAGVDFARKLKPDAVMICGSDTWLSKNWVEKMLPHLNSSEVDVIGKNIFHTCLLLKCSPISIVKGTYIPRKKMHPAGSGRIMSRDILEKLDWKVFPEDKSRGLDSNCFRRISSVGGKHKVFNDDEDVISLGLKSYWDTITSFNRIQNSHNLRNLPFDESNPERWLDANFDGCSKVLQKIVDSAYKEVGPVRAKRIEKVHLGGEDPKKKQERSNRRIVRGGIRVRSKAKQKTLDDIALEAEMLQEKRREGKALREQRKRAAEKMRKIRRIRGLK